MLSTCPTQFSMPFVEKYRPETLDDVVGNTVAIEQLKNIVQFGNMPNLILVVSEVPLTHRYRDRQAPVRPPACSVWRAKCSRKP